ncbi:MAG: sigma-70 family RNA polymerase sigma factor [Xanthomonadales bacterium]
MQNELAALGNGAHALAIQILGNPDDAADAVHDAFAQVLARPQAWDRTRGPLRPWFLRVVRNRCIDLLRRRRPTGVPVEGLAADGAGPDAALETLQRDRRLERALAELGPEQRQIIVLRDYSDLSYAEIAAVLGLAPGTVMSRLHRARLALRERLERSDDD